MRERRRSGRARARGGELRLYRGRVVRCMSSSAVPLAAGLKTNQRGRGRRRRREREGGIVDIISPSGVVEDRALTFFYSPL